jgi:hypothetical protein
MIFITKQKGNEMLKRHTEHERSPQSLSFSIFSVTVLLIGLAWFAIWRNYSFDFGIGEWVRLKASQNQTQGSVHSAPNGELVP